MSYVPMRELQQAIIALERMGTGLLRTGGALERIAAAMEAANKRSTSSEPVSSTGTKGDSR